MPLHCRRCYEIFDSETSLTEHSRNEVTCPVKQMIALEGFSKEQEKDLKGRRGMFRAGSEEHKWKIVYMILFPETPATEMPSPCKLNVHKLPYECPNVTRLWRCQTQRSQC